MSLTVQAAVEGSRRTSRTSHPMRKRPRGFILSPVDNITVDDPQTWHNIEAFIDEWREYR